jgi:hypothetical protein
MIIRIASTPLLLAGLLLLFGCKRSVESLNTPLIKTMNNYDLAIQSGVRGSMYPREFNRLFPNAINVISYYTGEIGPPTWTSSIGLYNRYVFKLRLSIELDSARTNIISTGPPTFYLYEIPKIDVRPNAEPYIHLQQLGEFSADAWRRLVEANGDFSALGVVLQTNNPVQDFEDNWRRF